MAADKCNNDVLQVCFLNKEKIFNLMRYEKENKRSEEPKKKNPLHSQYNETTEVKKWCIEG